MPPRKSRKTVSMVPSKATVRIDPNKHVEKLKEIEMAHRQWEEELAVDGDEESLEEEEMGSEEEYEMTLSEIEFPEEIGRIDLSFPETAEIYSDSPECFLPSYYTISSKERLLLVYAENFRKQFMMNYPNLRPLVLAVYNECKVQKFVCTTIRPTAFLHLPLIGSLEGCASFVADFITYETSADIVNFPTRLMSPSSLLRRRRGNSFEMATLLCSMLIGAGFPAMVVSGVARAETVMNNQHEEQYPHKIEDIIIENKVEVKQAIGQKYKLRPMPDLESHLEENMAEVIRVKQEEEQRLRKEIERLQKEELELRAVDRYHYRRLHAWVVVIENAPWSIKPRKTYVNDDGEPPKGFFIEPSTGFICDTHCKQYILIDSVWNDQNYYVNKQNYQRVGEIRWDLRDNNDWEHLLPGEPPEMRINDVFSDENIMQSQNAPSEEKHIDSIRSWVAKLHIGEKEFEERFPKLKKTVNYKRIIHERYSPYSQRDGKVMQIKMFADDDYAEPLLRWTYYKNRKDYLEIMKFSYAEKRIQETFANGRNDSLKYIEYFTEPQKPKNLHFYSAPRLDSLQHLEIYTDHIILHYTDRRDRCIFREFEFKSLGHVLKKTVEKFQRDETKNIAANDDIAVRTFLLSQRKILLKFHYARGALTASTREFIKPPKPDYGHEIKFDPSLTKAYKANTSDINPTHLELYKLLLDQLDQEEKLKKEFEKIFEEISNLLERRKNEMKHPELVISIFDPLRNQRGRDICMDQETKEESYRREVAQKPADFLAPYLVPYGNKVLNYDQSWTAYNACLNDLRSRFVGLLNDLQRQYEDLTSEAKSLQRFLNKFETQFSNYDYDRLTAEAKNIELHKRMVQQRLTLTHEESQKKYEHVKESLLKDDRLNLRNPSVA